MPPPTSAPAAAWKSGETASSRSRLAVRTGDEARDALKRQVSRSVLWTRSMALMNELGVEACVECGPGKVLAGLVKRIDGTLTAASIHDPATLAEVKGILA